MNITADVLCDLTSSKRLASTSLLPNTATHFMLLEAVVSLDSIFFWIFLVVS